MILNYVGQDIPDRSTDRAVVLICSSGNDMHEPSALGRPSPRRTSQRGWFVRAGASDVSATILVERERRVAHKARYLYVEVERRVVTINVHSRFFRDDKLFIAMFLRHFSLEHEIPQ